MFRTVRSLAILAARFDDWAEKAPARNQLAMLPYLPLVMVPLIVPALRARSSIWLTLGLGVTLWMGSALALPRYGRRLLGWPSPAARRADAQVAARQLVERSVGHLTAQRAADADLLLEAGLPQDAMKLVLEDLAICRGSLTDAEVEQIVADVERIGLDREARVLLGHLGLDPERRIQGA